jgi:hypothetical protein
MQSDSFLVYIDGYIMIWKIKGGKNQPNGVGAASTTDRHSMRSLQWIQTYCKSLQLLNSKHTLAICTYNLKWWTRHIYPNRITINLYRSTFAPHLIRVNICKYMHDGSLVLICTDNKTKCKWSTIADGWMQSESRAQAVVTPQTNTLVVEHQYITDKAQLTLFKMKTTTNNWVLL